MLVAQGRLIKFTCRILEPPSPIAESSGGSRYRLTALLPANGFLLHYWIVLAYIFSPGLLPYAAGLNTPHATLKEHAGGTQSFYSN